MEGIFYPVAKGPMFGRTISIYTYPDGGSMEAMASRCSCSFVLDSKGEREAVLHSRCWYCKNAKVIKISLPGISAVTPERKYSEFLGH